VNAYLLNSSKVDTLACDTFHADVTQAGVLHYNWFDAMHQSVRDFTQSGNYYVDISFINGCAVRDSINLTIASSPQINLGHDTTFCKGNLPLDATCASCTYQWSTGESTATILAEHPDIYWVNIVDANGCQATDTLVVKPQLSVLDFVMPNIVTPNQDNINDEIDFEKYQFSTFRIDIYNRWGQKVFSSDDAGAVWKPTGDEGTYFYTGQYNIDCGTESRTKNIKGFVTVVK
jgi:gliding motility-associated-like protein